jgi:hypothetical protein
MAVLAGTARGIFLHICGKHRESHGGHKVSVIRVVVNCRVDPETKTHAKFDTARLIPLGPGHSSCRLRRFGARGRGPTSWSWASGRVFGKCVPTHGGVAAFAQPHIEGGNRRSAPINLGACAPNLFWKKCSWKG